jgi:hypothetical protein
LIAELKWFLKEDRNKQAHACKRKRHEMAKKRRTQMRPVIMAEAINSLENDLNSVADTDADANENNNIPDADEAHMSEVKEAIKVIGVTACDKGHRGKQITEEVMWLFINTHLLHGSKHCCHFHVNHFY